MITAVIYFVAALILFLIFIAVIALAVTMGITLAKAKEKKQLAAEGPSLSETQEADGEK